MEQFSKPQITELICGTLSFLTNAFNLLQWLSEKNEPSKQLRDTPVIKAEVQ